MRLELHDVGLGQRTQLKIQERVNIEFAGLVVGEERGIARLVALRVDNAEFDQELCPAVIAVAGDQGVVEVEQRQAPRRRFHSISCCIQSLIIGTVIGRLVASERRSSASSVASSERMSRRPWRSR